MHPDQSNSGKSSEQAAPATQRANDSVAEYSQGKCTIPEKVSQDKILAESKSYGNY